MLKLILSVLTKTLILSRGGASLRILPNSNSLPSAKYHMNLVIKLEKHMNLGSP